MAQGVGTQDVKAAVELFVDLVGEDDISAASYLWEELEQEVNMALNMSGSQKGEYAAHLGDAPQTKVTKPITGSALTEKLKKGQVTESHPSVSEMIHPGVFSSNGMQITCEGSRTINLGNYESARIGVSITVPCEASNLQDAYTFATEWVSARIQSEMAQMSGEDGSKS